MALAVAVVAGGCSRSGLDDELLPTDDGGLSPDSPIVGDSEPPPEGAPPPSCGDHMCDNGETCMTCALDCGTCPGCGDGTCGEGETCFNCPQDCGTCKMQGCGNPPGICKAGFNCQNCPMDCGQCPSCGDGTCESNENCYSCQQDCGKCQGCGDGTCQSNETCASCPEDCGPCSFCGDGKCEMNESCVNCPQDCGMCATNKTCFQVLECAIGCFGGLGGLGGGGGFGGGDGGFPMINLQCVADCEAEGCASAAYFVNQAINCILPAIFTTCNGQVSLSCLMGACSGQFSACLNDTCQ